MLAKRFFAGAGRCARRAAVDPRLVEDGGPGARRGRGARWSTFQRLVLSQSRAVATPAGPARELAGTAPAFRRVLLKLSGRGADGRPRVRHRPERRSTRSRARSPTCTPTGVELAIVVGGGNIYRGMAAAAEGMDRATADYAGMLATRPQRARAAGRARARRRRHARALGDRGRGGRGAVHPPPRDPPPREGPGRHLRGRHRQPVLHDRHRRRAARARDRRRGDPDGEERRRGRLRRRPAHRPERDVPARAHAPRGDRARASR